MCSVFKIAIFLQFKDSNFLVGTYMLHLIMQFKSVSKLVGRES